MLIRLSQRAWNYSFAWGAAMMENGRPIDVFCVREKERVLSRLSAAKEGSPRA